MAVLGKSHAADEGMMQFARVAAVAGTPRETIRGACQPQHQGPITNSCAYIPVRHIPLRGIGEPSPRTMCTPSQERVPPTRDPRCTAIVSSAHVFVLFPFLGLFLVRRSAIFFTNSLARAPRSRRTSSTLHHTDMVTIGPGGEYRYCVYTHSLCLRY